MGTKVLNFELDIGAARNGARTPTSTVGNSSMLVTWSVAHTQTGDLVAASPAPDCSRGASSDRLGGATRPRLRWVAAECGRTGRPVGQPDCQLAVGRHTDRPV